MGPSLWRLLVALSPAEEAVVKRVRRAKLFPFPRAVRHKPFDDAFQAELAALYEPSPRGQPPIAPAQLALATILQAYTGASDAEAIEALTMARHWQLVLGCLDCAEAPSGKATLQRFSAKLIAAGLDRRLIERTVELAITKRESLAYSPPLPSSPSVMLRSDAPSVHGR